VAKDQVIMSAEMAEQILEQAELEHMVLPVEADLELLS
jgi:hypothetical protein